MGKQEMDSLYYNEVYRKGGLNENYFKAPEQSYYYQIWRIILQMLDEKSIIADFGCGVGQFAQLVVNHRFNYAFGVDFSEKAIEMAKERTGMDCFFLGDLYDENSFKIKEFNTAILLEVLEHIENDQLVISYLPEGARVIFSVPNFDDPAHLRTYDPESIKERYKALLDIVEIKRFAMRGEAAIFLCDAVKRSNRSDSIN